VIGGGHASEEARHEAFSAAYVASLKCLSMLCSGKPFGGHFRLLLPPGRHRSFSAALGLSYYAAA
jgi:hypothetical protein